MFLKEPAHWYAIHHAFIRHAFELRCIVDTAGWSDPVNKRIAEKFRNLFITKRFPGHDALPFHLDDSEHNYKGNRPKRECSQVVTWSGSSYQRREKGIC